MTEPSKIQDADFDNSEVSDEIRNKKFAKASRFSQEYEQTFSLNYNNYISERNYYGERFDGAAVYADSINKAEC